MEVDEKPTEKYTDIGGLDKQIQEVRWIGSHFKTMRPLRLSCSLLRPLEPLRLLPRCAYSTELEAIAFTFLTVELLRLLSPSLELLYFLSLTLKAIGFTFTHLGAAALLFYFNRP